MGKANKERNIFEVEVYFEMGIIFAKEIGIQGNMSVVSILVISHEAI